MRNGGGSSAQLQVPLQELFDLFASFTQLPNLGNSRNKFFDENFASHNTLDQFFTGELSIDDSWGILQKILETKCSRLILKITNEQLIAKLHAKISEKKNQKSFIQKLLDCGAIIRDGQVYNIGAALLSCIETDELQETAIKLKNELDRNRKVFGNLAINRALQKQMASDDISEGAASGEVRKKLLQYIDLLKTKKHQGRTVFYQKIITTRAWKKFIANKLDPKDSLTIFKKIIEAYYFQMVLEIARHKLLVGTLHNLIESSNDIQVWLLQHIHELFLHAPSDLRPPSIEATATLFSGIKIDLVNEDKLAWEKKAKRLEPGMEQNVAWRIIQVFNKVISNKANPANDDTNSEAPDPEVKYSDTEKQEKRPSKPKPLARKSEKKQKGDKRKISAIKKKASEAPSSPTEEIDPSPRPRKKQKKPLEQKQSEMDVEAESLPAEALHEDKAGDMQDVGSDVDQLSKALLGLKNFKASVAKNLEDYFADLRTKHALLEKFYSGESGDLELKIFDVILKSAMYIAIRPIIKNPSLLKRLCSQDKKQQEFIIKSLFEVKHNQKEYLQRVEEFSKFLELMDSSVLKNAFEHSDHYGTESNRKFVKFVLRKNHFDKQKKPGISSAGLEGSSVNDLVRAINDLAGKSVNERKYCYDQIKEFNLWKDFLGNKLPVLDSLMLFRAIMKSNYHLLIIDVVKRKSLLATIQAEYVNSEGLQSYILEEVWKIFKVVASTHREIYKQSAFKLLMRIKPTLLQSALELYHGKLTVLSRKTEAQPRKIAGLIYSFIQELLHRQSNSSNNSEDVGELASAMEADEVKDEGADDVAEKFVPSVEDSDAMDDDAPLPVSPVLALEQPQPAEKKNDIPNVPLQPLDNSAIIFRLPKAQSSAEFLALLQQIEHKGLTTSQFSIVLKKIVEGHFIENNAVIDALNVMLHKFESEFSNEASAKTVLLCLAKVVDRIDFVRAKQILEHLFQYFQQEVASFSADDLTAILASLLRIFIEATQKGTPLKNNVVLQELIRKLIIAANSWVIAITDAELIKNYTIILAKFYVLIDENILLPKENLRSIANGLESLFKALLKNDLSFDQEQKKELNKSLASLHAANLVAPDLLNKLVGLLLKSNEGSSKPESLYAGGSSALFSLPRNAAEESLRASAAQPSDVGLFSQRPGSPSLEDTLCAFDVSDLSVGDLTPIMDKV